MINVLCIDNSETIRKVVQDCVLDLGYSFYQAENGKKGIELALKMDNLDLIILDWNMPVLSGKESLKRLRSNEKFNDILIFVLIKIENKQYALEALEMGANMYMLKPFSVNNMQEKIKELMKNAE